LISKGSTSAPLAKQSLALQKRLAALVLGCGLGRVWMDESETSTIRMANSRQQIRKLINDHVIYRRPVGMHSQARHRKLGLAK
jgi:large subunit ribosomal protein L19e